VPIDSDPVEARARLARVVRQTGLVVPEHAQLADSWSNDVWVCGDIVVRICMQGDRSRLAREAMIGAALPHEARYPKVLDYGEDDDIAWMFVRRVDGEPMWERWKTMDLRVLRSLSREFAELLRLIHGWTPPPSVLAALHAHDVPATGDVDAVVGHDLLPLPAPRWQPMIDAALMLPFVDAGVVRAVAARLEELTAHDPFRGEFVHLVHGDANYANLLEADGRVTALLDYEWARLGPPDAELVSVIRAAGYWRPEPRVDRPPVVAWLEEDYPEMFAAPDLRERVWITEITYLLRQLLVWPPDGPKETQVEEHPVNTLPRVAESPWPY
jgi:aminoglycoside phosphotransferase (APT) family kinase protein